MVNREYAKIIGGNIRRLRLEKGLLQKDLGERCGYESANTGRFMICRMEKGMANVPMDKLVNIANVLEVPFIELFRGIDELKENETKALELSDFLDNRELKLINVARELNAAGMEKLVDYARDLHMVSVYRRTDDEINEDE